MSELATGARHRRTEFDDPMKKAYWIDGRVLTERDLQDIRAQLHGFKTVTAISDEMRDVIETEWPDFAAKLLAPKDAR